MLLHVSALVLIVSSLSSITAQPSFSLSGKLGVFGCGAFQEYRKCGPKCPPSCDTLRDKVCCDVVCVTGCFCVDGYILETREGPPKCLPLYQCPLPGYLTFERPSLSVLEGVGVARIHVIRVNGSYGLISVRYRVLDPNTPYRGLTGQLVFPDGVISQAIEIPLMDDAIRGTDITITVELFEPSKKVDIVGGSFTLTILDDDMRPGYLELENTVISVPENVGSVLIKVLRLDGTDGQIRIRYRTVPDTARPIIDFVPLTGELIFEEGEEYKTLTLDVLDDEFRESEERFGLELFDPSAEPGVLNFRGLGSILRADITILDNDMKPGTLQIEQPSYTILESAGYLKVDVVRVDGQDGQIRVKYQSQAKTAVPGRDFLPITGDLVFEEGEILKTILMKIVDDDVREPPQSFEILLLDPTPGQGVINFRGLGSTQRTLVTIQDDDMKPGYLELEEQAYIISEGVGVFHIGVVRLGGSDGQIRVRYQTIAKTALVESDFLPTQGELVFEEGETRRTIDVQILNDNVREPSKIFEVQLLDPSPGQGVINFRGLGSRLTTTVTITDDDMMPGYLELEEQAYVVSEGVGVVRIGVVRLGGSDGQIRVRYQTYAQTALVKSDFVPTQGELVFEEGDTRKTIDVQILNDNVREPSKIFEVQLLDPSPGMGVINFRGLGSRPTTTVTITDDDMRPGYLELQEASYVISEGQGAVRIGVVRIGGSDGQIRVKYQTLASTALEQSDFVPVSGELVFEEGETRKTIDIQILDDNLREPTKVFEVQLLDAAPGLGVINFRGLGSRPTTVVTITDDDMTPGYLELEEQAYVVSEGVGVVRIGVVRLGGSDGQIRVRYQTYAQTALVKSDFVPTQGELVFEEGDTRKTIDVQILNDNVREPSKIFEVQLLDPSPGMGVINFRGLVSKPTTTVTITDDDMMPGYLELEEQAYVVSEGVGFVRIGVVRLGGSDGQIRVRYQTIAKTALVKSDFFPIQGELVFEEGETRKTIDVQILNDNVREPSKIFEVQLLDPSPGLGVINFRGLGSRPTTTVTITDDDMQPGYLELEEPSYVISEGLGTVQIGVVRVGGSDSQIRVKYQTLARTALVQSDFVPVSGELVFEEGETRKTIDIQILDDNLREPTKVFEVQLLDAAPGQGVINFRGLGSIHTTVVTITDDDMSPGFLELEEPSYAVSEGLGTVRIGVVRVGGTDGQIRVKYQTLVSTALEQRDFVPVSGELVFEEGETRKTIDIQILDDNLREPTKVFEVQLLDAAPGPGVINFRGLGSRPTTVVTITDDDMKPGFLELEGPSYVVSEGLGTVRIGVVRIGGSDGQIRVKYQTLASTALEQRDFVPVSGELVFEEGETRKTIDIQILDDNLREPTKVFEVQLLDAAPGPGVINFRGLGSRPTTVVTITDDDMTPGYLEIEEASYVISEGVGVVRIGVVRQGGSDGQIRVRYQTIAKTALVTSDFVPIEGELVFEEGETRKTIDVQILNDNVREPSKIFEVQLLDPSPGQGVINFRGLGSRPTTTVTITDDDMMPGFLEMERPTYVVSEGTGTLQIVVVRVGGSDGQIRVRYQTRARTAVAGMDFSPVKGELVFEEGETRKTILVQIKDDQVRELTKDFEIQLLDPTPGLGVINFRGLGRRQASVVTISDDDMTPGFLELERPSYTVSEDVGVLEVVVLRVGGSDGQIRVKYQTKDQTAVQGVDFIHSTGDLLFEEGETRKSIRVQIANDKVKEPIKSFEVQLLDPTPGNGVINFRGLGQTQAAVVTINDDDWTPGYLELEEPTYVVSEGIRTLQIVVVRVGGSDGRIRVRYQTTAKTALAGSDFVPGFGELVFEEGETRKTIDVRIVNDRIKEPIKSFEVQLLDPTPGLGVLNFKGLGARVRTWISIADDDTTPGTLEIEEESYVFNEDAGTVLIPVVRVGGSDGQIRVRYETVARSALEGSDFAPAAGDLVFQHGETRKFITVQILNDNIKEPAKSFEVQLLEPTPGPGVLNFRGLGSRSKSKITITDNDNSPGVFGFRETKISIREGSGKISLTVLRSEGTDGAVSLTLRTADGSATQRQDYRSRNSVLQFGDGEKQKTIDIDIINDDVNEGEETFVVSLSDPTNNGVLGPDCDATIIIVDDDEIVDKPEITAPETRIFFTETTLTVPQDAKAVRFKIRREGDLTARASVFLETKDGTARGSLDYRRTRGDVQFGFKEIELTLEIKILDNPHRKGAKTFSVKISKPSSGVVVSGKDVLAILIGAPDALGVTQKPSPKQLPGSPSPGQSFPGSQLPAVPSSQFQGNFDPGSSFSVQLRPGSQLSGQFTHGSQMQRQTFSGLQTSGFATSGQSFQGLPSSGQSLSGLTGGSMLKFSGQTTSFISIPGSSNLPPGTNFQESAGLSRAQGTIIRIEEASFEIVENVGTVRIPVVRTGSAEGTIRVRYQTIPRTALPGVDFMPISGEVIFEPGETRKFIIIRILNDNIKEPTKHFVVKLVEATPLPGSVGFRGKGSSPSAIVTITDDDGSPGILELEEASYVISESIGAVRIPVVRVGGSDGQIRVRYQTVSRSAEAGTDFAPSTGEIVFEPGETKKFIVITILNDDLKEANKHFDVQLSQPASGPGALGFRGLGSRSTATISITDDDDCPEGMVFRECSPSCPRVCNVEAAMQRCNKKCVSGCFCPEGLFIESFTSLRCIPPSQCRGGRIADASVEGRGFLKGLLFGGVLG